MAIVDVLYEVESTVWAVDKKVGLRKGEVLDVKVTIDEVHGTVIKYDIRHYKTNSGKATYEEADVYDDVDVALAAYKLLVE